MRETQLDRLTNNSCRVKSGNYGHQVNLDIHKEPSHQDFHCLLS